MILLLKLGFRFADSFIWNSSHAGTKKLANYYSKKLPTHDLLSALNKKKVQWFLKGPVLSVHLRD